jgi:hypothetical protein
VFKFSSLEDKAKDRAQKMGTIIQTKSGQEESSSGHALNPLLTSRKHELQSLSLLAVWGLTLVARRTLWLGPGLPLPVRAIMPSIPIP